MAERAVRTLLEIFVRYEDARGEFRWLDVLQAAVRTHNESKVCVQAERNRHKW